MNKLLTQDSQYIEEQQNVQDALTIKECDISASQLEEWRKHYREKGFVVIPSLVEARRILKAVQLINHHLGCDRNWDPTGLGVEFLREGSRGYVDAGAQILPSMA